MPEIEILCERVSHEDWVKSIASAACPSKSQDVQIHKIPNTLRNNQEFSKYYEPRVVSIGPYHHHRHHDGCKLCQEEIKHKMAKDFALTDDHDATVEARIDGWFDNIKSKIGEWRDCYEENSTDEHEDEDFARMMLLDGCFILQYIQKSLGTNEEYQKYFRDMKMRSHEVAFVQQDLFLLENQLPYGVLKTLMGPNESTWMEKIKNFITTKIIKSKKPTPLDNRTNEDGAHLLELLRTLLLGCPSNKPGVNSTRNSQECWPFKRCQGGKNTNTWHSFRNITELIAVGIKLKTSKTCCLRDVTYTPCCMKAHLQLPPITIDDTTAAKFLNLIAYEMCHGGTPDDCAVTSYICFLDSLIDHPEDVKQLRDARILHNFLGSDEEVAELFNKISTDLVPDNDVYAEVKGKIQSQYDCKVKTWMAEVLHDHFSTPWTVMAFLAAIFAIGLSVIQTYLARFPPPGECDDLCKHLS